MLLSTVGGSSPRTGECDPPVAPTRTRPRTSGMAVEDALFGCGVWVCTLFVLKEVGDGRRTWSGDPVSVTGPAVRGRSVRSRLTGRSDCGRQKPPSLVSAWRRPRAGDVSPPLPRSGCVGGHTGPSSVTGSNKRVSCAAPTCRKGNVQSHVPPQEYGVSSSPPVSRNPEWRSAQFDLMKRTESRAVLGYGRPRSAP